MIDWELEDKTIHISKDGIASEKNYYKYKDWRKVECIKGKEIGVCISRDKTPFLCASEDSERSALLNMLEECDRIRRIYNDLSEEIQELLEMEGNDK